MEAAFSTCGYDDCRCVAFDFSGIEILRRSDNASDAVVLSVS
jgi:hypothetical protein